MIIVVAMILLIVGLTSRIFMRIPPGTVGLVARAGRHQGVREAGVNRVNPFLALTHVVTTRELAFDVPVAAVRSSDGVNVNVDLRADARDRRSREARVLDHDPRHRPVHPRDHARTGSAR